VGETDQLPITVEDLGARQRDISISEFFLKNRHLLGFDTPAKALVTAVKEAIDNAIDACEDAAILPDIRVEINRRGSVYTVVVEDNGPGIVDAQISRIFGKLLYGSKFHKLSQLRGQQCMGIAAAGTAAALVYQHRRGGLGITTSSAKAVELSTNIASGLVAVSGHV